MGGERIMVQCYFDNCIVSGMARGDLDASQMAVFPLLEQAKQDGRLEVLTSRETWREQERATSPSVRAQLERSRGNVPLVSDDHSVLGFFNITDQLGGFTANPMVTEIVDEGLFVQLRKEGLRDADARHLMYAVHNACVRFVTTDPDFLNRRPQLQRLCRGLTIVTPVELATELSFAGKPPSNNSR